MKEAIRSLLALILLGGFLELLLPEDKMRGYSRLIVGLLVLFSLMRMVITGIEDLTPEMIFRSLQGEEPPSSQSLLEEGERINRAGAEKAGEMIAPVLTEKTKKLIQEVTGDEKLQLELVVTKGERITGVKIVLSKDLAWPSGTLERLAGGILGINPEKVEVEKAFARSEREKI